MKKLLLGMIIGAAITSGIFYYVNKQNEDEARENLKTFLASMKDSIRSLDTFLLFICLFEKSCGAWRAIRFLGGRFVQFDRYQKKVLRASDTISRL